MGKVRSTPDDGCGQAPGAWGRFGLPWPLAVSAALHAFVLILLGLFVSSVRQPHNAERPLSGLRTPLREPPEPMYPPVSVVMYLSDRGPYSETARHPFFVAEQDAVQQRGAQKEPTETPALRFRQDVLQVRPPGNINAEPEPIPEDWEKSNLPGQIDAISDVPLWGTGVVCNLGVGGGGSGCFGESMETGGPRKSGRREAACAAADHALERALRWLAANQEADGSWLVREHGGSMTDDATVAVTGLAVLALLANGHTESTGRYRERVTSGIAFLVGHQDAQGQIGANATAGGGAGYNHAIAGLALAESSRLGGRSSTRAAAQGAADWSSGPHQTECSGWGHLPASPEGSTDVSVWFILQLRTALSAGLKVPGRSFQGAANWLADVEHPGEGNLFSETPGAKPSPASTAAGALGCLSLGWSFAWSADDVLMKNPPAWGRKDFGYWYHATRVLLNERHSTWGEWRAGVVDVLTTHQRRGGPADGSWDPEGDPWGEMFGRASVTALGALVLDTLVRLELREVRGWRRELLLKWKAYQRYYVE